MFYVYCSADYPVYEPAEGGYYVAASKITWCHEFDTLEAAYRDFLSEVQDTEKHGIAISNAYFTCEFPWAQFNETGYIGDGFEIAISDEKPQDKPYEGYC